MERAQIHWTSTHLLARTMRGAEGYHFHENACTHSPTSVHACCAHQKHPRSSQEQPRLGHITFQASTSPIHFPCPMSHFPSQAGHGKTRLSKDSGVWSQHHIIGTHNRCLWSQLECPLSQLASPENAQTGAVPLLGPWFASGLANIPCRKTKVDRRATPVKLASLAL